MPTSIPLLSVIIIIIIPQQLVNELIVTIGPNAK